jgi:hypothetical protein
MPPSLSEKMKQAAAKRDERKREPWFDILEHIAGRIDNDGIERISTQAVFDVLRIPMARRVLPAQIRFP